jgi:outer membrane protein
LFAGTTNGIGYNFSHSESMQYGLRITADLGRAEYMQSFFGVTAAQAMSSGYRRYSPKASVRNGRANLALTYMASPRASLAAGVTANTLQGDAADSPLVRKKTSVNGLLAAAYAF